MNHIYQALLDAGIPVWEYGVTALDAYWDRPPRPVRFLVAACSQVDLARVFENLEYPGLPYADASLNLQSQSGEQASPAGTGLRFLCMEKPVIVGRGGWLAFRRNVANGVFHDDGAIYQALRSGRSPDLPTASENSLFDAAILATLYPSPPQIDPSVLDAPEKPSSDYQRDLLIAILAGPYPASGLDLLMRNGFIERVWPELARLRTVDHSKEFHPEGDGWEHTLETFSHRKTPDLVLSLALLLHDIGKPLSAMHDGRRFDRHAELGATLARKILMRMGFPLPLCEDVAYLIRYHMMPAALPSLPVSKVEQILRDPRFPVLLELFRCDEFSSFKEPERYYQACAAYRQVQRNIRNPYRNADGSLYSERQVLPFHGRIHGL